MISACTSSKLPSREVLERVRKTNRSARFWLRLMETQEWFACVAGLASAAGFSGWNCVPKNGKVSLSTEAAMGRPSGIWLMEVSRNIEESPLSVTKRFGSADQWCEL